MAETEGHKEKILKLIMEHNAQIREMEEEMDKSIKEKEQSVQMAIIPMETHSDMRSENCKRKLKKTKNWSLCSSQHGTAAKVKDMSHQLLPQNQHQGSEQMNRIPIFCNLRSN